ncbi:helix-turn-helix transcriptional regulator [Mycobacterium intracellulare]|uniref:helix-turn-helix transcriptional regulator n=1 Tax=Mycobacterium intracellulare TaxID=1767 RepID=UPI000B2C41C6|nr:AraC family transcriptional regulator [Mycobacterium intracellulare]
MTDRQTVNPSDTDAWTTTNSLDDFALLCCPEPHLEVRSDPRAFSLTQRTGRIGPIAFSDFVTGSDVFMDSGEYCSGYRINVVQSGGLESIHNDLSLRAGAGTVAVHQPEGYGAGRWAAGSRMLGVKIDRRALEDALGDALGRQVKSQVDFTPITQVGSSSPTRSWVNMVMLFTEQFCRADGLLNQPLVALPFVDSLVRGFLLAVDHPHREAIATDIGQAPPRTIRAAIDVIEAQAQLPMTVSSLAARSHVSVRSLQEGFRSYLGVSPMAYLRQVRLRRAHQDLLESDSSTVTVASVAYRWGFTNLGRFATEHAHRYGEAPSATLHRRPYPRRA